MSCERDVENSIMLSSLVNPLGGIVLDADTRVRRDLFKKELDSQGILQDVNTGDLPSENVESVE